MPSWAEQLVGRWRWKTHEPVAAGVTTRTIRSPVVPREQVRWIETLNVLNEDSAGSDLHLYIERDGQTHLIWHRDLTTANVWYRVKLEVTLFGGECLRYDFSACTAADDLYIVEVGTVMIAPKTFEDGIAPAPVS